MPIITNIDTLPISTLAQIHPIIAMIPTASQDPIIIIIENIKIVDGPPTQNTKRKNIK